MKRRHRKSSKSFAQRSRAAVFPSPEYLCDERKPRGLGRRPRFLEVVGGVGYTPLRAFDLVGVVSFILGE